MECKVPEDNEDTLNLVLVDLPVIQIGKLKIMKSILVYHVTILTNIDIGTMDACFKNTHEREGEYVNLCKYENTMKNSTYYKS